MEGIVMRKHCDGNNSNKIGIGVSIGVTFGFLLGMLVNSLFIPIGIALGSFFDIWKDKRNK